MQYFIVTQEKERYLNSKKIEGFDGEITFQFQYA